MKKFLLVLTIGTIMLTGCSFATANDDIKVTLNGTELAFDVKPQIIDGRTVVPFRKIFEEIGAVVKWNNDTKTVSAKKGSKTVTMTIDSKDMQIQKGTTSETVTLEVPSQIIDNRTLVPVRAISEAFGLQVDWDEDSKTVVIADTDVQDDSWKENTGTIDLTDLTYTGNGIEITDNQIKITAGGDFTLTGTLDDGNITINTTQRVKLRLSGANVTSSTGACIYFEEADKGYITITDNTENSLTAVDNESDALYSKENLEIKGNGTLNITAKGGHSIKASDNLTIENGVINLKSESDGIHVNDTFKMTGGTVNASVVGDGIDSESIVIIEGGTLNIETNGTPLETKTTDTTYENTGFNPFEDEADVEFEKSSKGINAEWMMQISGGDITVNSASHGIHCQDEIEITGGTFNIASTYDKGISAHGNLTIEGDSTIIDITKSTEGIESKNVMTINNGTINIAASDDGLNATGGNAGFGGDMGFGGRADIKSENNTKENSKIPADRKQNRPQRNHNNQNGEPPKMPENGQMPTPPQNGEMQTPPDFNNGNIPQQGGGMMGGNRPQGGGMMGGNQKECLIINAGNIEIIAGDDCLDANGNMTINGGTIKAIKENGSFTGAFGIFDADGKVNINEGATVMLAGNGGSLTTSENSISVYCENTHNKNEAITVKDDNGNIILEYVPQGSFRAVLLSSPMLKTGETYSIYIGDEKNEVTISQQNTVIGTQTNGGDIMGGFGGRPR